jgi:hypothetical protein
MLFACKIVVPFPLSIGEILGYFFFTINYIDFLTWLIRDPWGGPRQGSLEKNYGPLQNTPFELHFSPTFLGPPPPRPKICTKHTKSYGLP